MKKPVIVIGLDGADPIHLEEWMAQGHLPNFSRLRNQGCYGRLKSFVNYSGVPTPTSSTEKVWVMTWTGLMPEKHGFFATSKYFPDYTISRDMSEMACDFEKNPPFYALGQDYRVFVLDPPVSGLNSQVNGSQVLAWGGHFPFTPSHSSPPGLLPEIIQKYGENSILYKDIGIWWDKKYEQWLPKAIKNSLEVRAQICRDALRQENWDLFIVGIGEAHTAGHDLWHTHPDHPLYESHGKAAGPLLLDAFKDIDYFVGEILDAAPKDAYVVAFSPHGMWTNHSDVLSTAVLPEMMYRYNFGKAAIAPGNINDPPSPMVTKPFRNSWMGEMWVRNQHPNRLFQKIRPYLPGRFLKSRVNGLESPFTLLERKAPVGWMPAMWYSPLWPQMKAFALPYFADGHVRINVKGREANGVVDPEDYNAILSELTDLILDLRDARTGKRVVHRIARPRRTPFDEGHLSDADLVVIWEEHMTDVVDSPTLGRFGPVPHFRSGTHRPRGFFMAKGSGIEAGSIVDEGQVLDIAPTVRRLLGADIPDCYDGRALLDQHKAERSKAA